MSMPIRVQILSGFAVFGIAVAVCLPLVLLSAAQEQTLKPKDTFKECESCPEMVVIPSGSFIMGESNSDPWPPHRVEFSQAFAVGKFQITVDQFAAFVRATGYETGSKCRTFVFVPPS